MWKLSETVIYDPKTGIKYEHHGNGDVSVSSAHSGNGEEYDMIFDFGKAAELWARLLRELEE